MTSQNAQNETANSSNWHKEIMQNLTLLPQSLLESKELKQFLSQLDKKLRNTESDKDLAEHSLRIVEIEKRELERKIAAINEKFDLASQASQAGIWEWMGTTGQISWDDQMFRIYGIENKDLYPDLSKSFFDFVIPEDKAILRNSFSSISAASNIFNAEFKICREGDQAIRNLELTALIRFDLRSTPVRMVGVCVDVTEKKITEAERLQFVNNLINYNKDLEDFAFVVSHRLRSHTSKFQTAISVLTNVASIEKLRDIIIDEVNKEAKMMDETLRDLAKVLSLKSENHIFESIPLKSFAKTVVDSFTSADCEFQLNINKDLNILGIRNYLSSIFNELIQNAIKFQRESEKLIISIIAKENANEIEIIFSDNGIGIDMEKNKAKLFGLYRKFNLNIEGKGIGLHIVKKQMDIMDGKVRIQSEPQVGTTISLLFPKYKT